MGWVGRSPHLSPGGQALNCVGGLGGGWARKEVRTASCLDSGGQTAGYSEDEQDGQGCNWTQLRAGSQQAWWPNRRRPSSVPWDLPVSGCGSGNGPSRGPWLPQERSSFWLLGSVYWRPCLRRAATVSVPHSRTLRPRSEPGQPQNEQTASWPRCVS